MYTCKYDKKGDKLGEGSFGEVSKVIKNNQEYVFKRIISSEDKGRGKKLSKFSDPIELDIMFRLQSPYLVKGVEITIAGECSPKDAGLVMEYVNGNLQKELYTLSYKDKKKIMYDLALALKCLHDNNFLHLDIKTDNAMFHKATKTEPVRGVLIDYGLASYVQDIEKGIETHHARITLDYNSPEASKQSIGGDPDVFTYTNKDDIWALGATYVDFFIDLQDYLLSKNIYTLSGSDAYAPENYEGLHNFLMEKFNKKNIDKFLEDKILNVYTLNKQEENELKNLLKGMFKIDPKSRFNITDVVNHSYFKEFRNNEISCMVKAPEIYGLLKLTKNDRQGLKKLVEFCYKDLYEQNLEILFIAIDIYLRFILLADKAARKALNNILPEICGMIANKYFNWAEYDDLVNTLEEIADLENIIYKVIGGKIHEERHYTLFRNIKDAQLFYDEIIRDANVDAYFMDLTHTPVEKRLVAKIGDLKI